MIYRSFIQLDIYFEGFRNAKLIVRAVLKFDRFCIIKRVLLARLTRLARYRHETALRVSIFCSFTKRRRYGMDRLRTGGVPTF